jgi:hypothetical protein
MPSSRRGRGRDSRNTSVVQDGRGAGKGAKEVFGAFKIDGVFDADAGVALGEGGGGDADMTDAAVEEGGGQAGGIEEGAAADGEAIGMAADVAGAQGIQHPADGGGRLLDGFAAGKNQGGAHELKGIGMGLEIGADPGGQIREGLLHAAVYQDQAAMAAVRLAADDGIAERGIARGEQIAGVNTTGKACRTSMRWRWVVKGGIMD